MDIKQAGIVTNMPEIINNKTFYEVNIDGQGLTVKSDGMQAVKDYLFIKQGQNVVIEGDIFDKHIEVQKARIDILGIINIQ